MAKLKCIAGLILVLAFMGSAQAMLITYSAEFIGGTDWRYRYTATNDLPGEDVSEITIYFDRQFYSNLSIEATPVGWDTLVVQADPGIPANGFFDALAMVDGIAPGKTAGGFVVRFTYLGQGAPGAQAFDVLDNEFNVIGTGSTLREMPGNTVPEPHGLLLFLAGALTLVTRKCGHKSHVTPFTRGETTPHGGQHA
ncbi:hypothetical protein B0920_08465 [Massilia sp. KIM]|nr:hypothetical protein B0920_08465 [Massilia sp. KIM]